MRNYLPSILSASHHQACLVVVVCCGVCHIIAYSPYISGQVSIGHVYGSCFHDFG